MMMTCFAVVIKDHKAVIIYFLICHLIWFVYKSVRIKHPVWSIATFFVCVEYTQYNRT